MSLTPSTNSSRSLQIFKTVLYILAGLILVLGLVAGFSLITSANSLAANAMLPFQLFGGGAASNLFSSIISGFLTNLGVVVIILSLVLSALLYGVGRLIGHISQLEARLARLEARPS